MPPSTPSMQLDTRPMAPLSRHALVTWTFDQMQANTTMELLSDHDPLPLQRQFEADKAGLFSGEYLESGPEVWRIAINKRKGQHGVSHCCGACGG